MKNDFKSGLRDGLPICLGYLSVAFAFGIFATNSGLTVWQAFCISVFNVTSAGQLAAVPIITSGGSLLELAGSQLIINLRYALMSVSLSQKMDGSMKTLPRLITAFINTDEVFAVSSSKKGLLGKSYFYGLILLPWLGWSLGTLAGAVAGDVLPEIVSSSLGISIYGMLIAIVVPVARTSRAVAVCSLIAAGGSCAFRYIPVLSRLPGGFALIICAVGAGALMALIAPLPPEKEVDDED
ncbi:MAG: AzlC family ABC transporter permease [Clostridia bacterium]|nr:AzlC family ABC transporter permease [Clostridia bacterium]